MSDTDETCEYVLDPDDPERRGGEEGDECYVDEEVLNEDGVWNCPHDAEEEKDLCIFHQPVEEKDDEEVVEKFLDIFDENVKNDNSENGKLQFVGGKFSSLDLGDVFSGSNLKNTTLTLSHANFYYKLKISGAEINLEKIDLQGSLIRDGIYFADCMINSIISGDMQKFPLSLSKIQILMRM